MLRRCFLLRQWGPPRGGWGGGSRGGDCNAQSFRDPRQLFNRDRSGNAGAGKDNLRSGPRDYERSEDFMRKMREEGARRSAIPSQVDHMPRTNKGKSGGKGFW